MTTFALPHDAPDVANTYGWGIAACDEFGRLREIPGTVPLKPRVAQPASYSAVVRGDGVEHSPIGGLLPDEFQPVELCREAQMASLRTLEEEICAEYELTKSTAAVGKRFGIHDSRINRILKRNGVAVREPKGSKR
jgi:hypothetical protein